MVDLLSVLVGLPALSKRKESRIAPYVRTLKLAEQEQEKAVLDLECATSELITAIEDKVKDKK